MPGGDRTGPYGAGPRTGRGLGFCRGYAQPGFASRWGGGFGYGRGGGFGRGWRNRFWATGVPGRSWYHWGGYWPEHGEPGLAEGSRRGQEDEITLLKEQADYFKGALDEIKQRLDELQGGKE